MKNFRLNKKGFTLIELMIVIAIIGVLAAVAIPNLINYRNLSYCSATETTARNVAVAIGEYFAVPSRANVIPVQGDLLFDATTFNKFIESIEDNDTGGFLITAKDPNERCPEKYREATTGWNKDDHKYEYNMN